MCFWEKERGYLFTGDLVYKDTLFAYYPSTDPEAYLASLERIAALPARKVFPAHHSLNLDVAICAISLVLNILLFLPRHKVSFLGKITLMMITLCLALCLPGRCSRRIILWISGRKSSFGCGTGSGS